MRGDEERVVAAFVAWLAAEGWDVQREVEGCDVVATRGGERLFAEAKGRTTSAGTDVDTMYGQLLRRMPEGAVGRARFALVVPEQARWHVLRVPARVRALLGVEVYTVADDGSVTPEQEPEQG